MKQPQLRKTVSIKGAGCYVRIYDDDSISIYSDIRGEEIELTEFQMRELSRILNNLKSGNL